MLEAEYKKLFSVFLEKPTLVEDGILNKTTIDRLLQEHLSKKKDNGNRLWLLLNAEVWYLSFIKNQSVSDLKNTINS